MKRNWYNEKNNLERLILIEKMSYEKIGRLYKCSGANIKKVANKLGIKILPRRKINKNESFNRGRLIKAVRKCLNCGKTFKKAPGSTGKYCSAMCGLEYKHKIGYQKILNGDESIMRANYSPKSFKIDILKEQNCVCAICGIAQEWNGKSLIFILDHIDGHAANNKRSNLRCICPNCDSQLDTYKSKNKYGERSYYRYHKNKKK